MRGLLARVVVVWVLGAAFGFAVAGCGGSGGGLAVGDPVVIAMPDPSPGVGVYGTSAAAALEVRQLLATFDVVGLKPLFADGRALSVADGTTGKVVQVGELVEVAIDQGPLAGRAVFVERGKLRVR